MDARTEIHSRSHFKLLVPKTKSFLHIHTHLFPIRHNLDPAMLIGSQQGVAAQGIHRFSVGAAIAIIGGHREQRQLRVQVGNPFRRVEGRVSLISQQQHADSAYRFAQFQSV